VLSAMVCWLTKLQREAVFGNVGNFGRCTPVCVQRTGLPLTPGSRLNRGGFNTKERESHAGVGLKPQAPIGPGFSPAAIAIDRLRIDPRVSGRHLQHRPHLARERGF